MRAMNHHSLVVLVEYPFAVHTVAPNTPASVLAAPLLFIPQSDIRIEEGHAILFIGHLYDLRLDDVAVLHTYVFNACQAEKL